jgi:outer membrane lipoprotein-sorting protein
MRSFFDRPATIWTIALTDRATLQKPTRRALLMLPAIFALGAALPAHAASPSGADAAELQQVQAYLNGIKTLQSRFNQVAADGSTASGMIYLERPGHLRLVYDAPSSILIVATGGQIYYYDPKLNQVSQIDVQETPAWFLLRSDVQLGGDITVAGIQHGADTLRISMVETKNPERGRVTMVLSEKPMQLRQWTVIDAQNKQVTVTLDNPQYGVALKPSLFQWSDPRPAASKEPGG